MPQEPGEIAADSSPPPNSRLAQWVLMGSLVPLSWLGMMLVHELGHVVGALATGGQVQRLVWHPLVISRTDVEPNPSPLVVVWAGPLLGVLAPLAAWAIVSALRLSWSYLPRFFAAFCLVANGAYIGGGSLGRFADAGNMLKHGSPIWLLWLFGLMSAAVGLSLWHGEGRHFGLGREAPPVVRLHAWVVLGLLLAMLAAGFLLGDRGL